MKDIEVLIPVLKGQSVNVPECLREYSVLTSMMKGRAVARNDLAKRSEASFLLYVDNDIHLHRIALERYIIPAMKENKVIAYEGKNLILCSRVLGIPRSILIAIGGFDETFDLGEDLELGYRLLDKGYVIEKIPWRYVDHLSSRSSSSKVISYMNRARLVLRYKKFTLFLPNRKFAPIGIIIMILAFYYYLFNNRRKNIATED